MIERTKKNLFGVVVWQEAFYSDRKKFLNLPTEAVEITCGLIDTSNKNFIRAGMNCSYNKKSKSFKIVDGILIPRRTVKKISYFNVEIWFRENQ